MPGLGRIPDPNVQDHLFLMRRKLGFVPAVEMPTAKTWAIDGHSIDQGNTGTCVGHAWRNFLRAKPIMTEKGGPSAWDIYRNAVVLDVWSDNDQEAKLPDGDRGFASGTSVRAGAQALQVMRRLPSYMWAFNLVDTVNWVLTQGPVVLGTNWYSGMDFPDEYGFCRVFGTFEGGHAYLLRGVNTKTKIATLENSWGDSWGQNGAFYMSFADLERLILEEGEACTAVEQYVPKP